MSITDIGTLVTLLLGFVGVTWKVSRSFTAVEKIIHQENKELRAQIAELDKSFVALAVTTRDVAKDHDKVVSLGLRADKAERDINGQYAKIRDVENNVGSFISTFRKGS